MEMHQIRYFLAVSQHLNFTRAAEECHVAQPSLTRAIKKLEEELGGELFRRERRATHLTELGRMMLPVLSQCYEGAQTARSLASSYAEGERAPLSIALSHSVSLGPFVVSLIELARALPGVSLSFFRGDAEAVAERLRSGEAELAIACGFAAEWERLNAWPLFSERFVVAMGAGHPLAARERIAVADLDGERLLLRPYCERHETLIAALGACGVATDRAHGVATEADVAALLEGGAGVVVLPASTQLPHGVSSAPLVEPPLERSVVLYEVAGRRRTPAASALVKLLRSADLAVAA